MILDAAGYTDIGDNPGLSAARGVRLTSSNYKRTLGRGIISARGEAPPGLVESSEHGFIATLNPDGSVAVKGGLNYSGKWWFEQDEFCMLLDHGRKLRHYLVLDGITLKFFTLDGTLDFKLYLTSP
jgi:hypothetical protein